MYWTRTRRVINSDPSWESLDKPLNLVVKLTYINVGKWLKAHVKSTATVSNNRRTLEEVFNVNWKARRLKKARLLEVPPNDPDVRVESQTRSTWAEMGAAQGQKVQHKMWELEIITRRTTNDPDVRVESQTRSTWAEMGAAHQNEQQPKFEKNVYIYIDIFFQNMGGI